MSIDRITLKIEGMTCGGCESSIKTALERLDGVQVLEASHQEGSVEVLFDPDRTSVDALAEAVDEAGFEMASAQ